MPLRNSRTSAATGPLTDACGAETANSPTLDGRVKAPEPAPPASAASLDRLGLTLLVKPRRSFSIGQHLAYIERLVSLGGPAPVDYEAFGVWLRFVAAETRAGRLSEGELRTLRDAFGRALSLETNQGLGLLKPHGYPGDYEIIDRIYRKQVTDDPTLRNWDLYFHEQVAPRAVRNRKAYFLDLLDAVVAAAEGDGPVHVLNVASGPARDVAEYFTRSCEGRVLIECVDADPNAVAYARTVCRPYLDRVTFKVANALRYVTDQRFRLIWSAGLFDYFGNEGFTFLLRRLLHMLEDHGELVIGNFSKGNASRDYMEVMGDWTLYYRDEHELRALALACGVAEADVDIRREPSGVNLFLHIKRGGAFVQG